MKSSVEQLNPVQYRLSVELSPEEVNKAFENAYKSLQKKARIQGFRPGKAPLGVIRKLYGGSVVQEVHEKLINQHVFSALNEHQVRPIASPMVESKAIPAEGREFNFSAVVDIMPTIAIDDYKGVQVSAETYTVKPETIDRELAMLRRRQARTREVEEGAAASKGMLASVTHAATLDGNPVPNMTSENMTVFLGENEIIEALETELLGMKKGETKTATIRMPDTFGDESLKGKDLVFTITVNDLKHLDIPSFDDEFAKDLNYESADKLKDDVKQHLESRAKDLGRQKVEAAVLDKIIDAHPFDVPPAMVDQVIDSMIQEMSHQSDAERAQALRNQELRKNMLETAKRRTQNTLLLWHVTQKEQLQVSDDEVRSRVEQAIASTGITDPKQTARLRKNIEPRVRENMIFEKAMDFLIDNAQVTAVPAEI